MIKQIAKLFIVAALMLMPCIAYAIPGEHGNFACNSCHAYVPGVGNNNIANNDVKYIRNVCLTCHTGGNENTSRQFVKDDFSNIYKNKGSVIQSATPMQTSHKWYGSDNIPAAGAVAPIDPRGSFGLNKSGFTGAITCARCHSVHGSSGTQSVVSPFLRMPNDSDQLCRSCHRLRDSKDHKTGTHPVNVSYSSARNANVIAAITTKTSFRAAPVTNAVNPTGQVKLVKNDLVVCSTCHGVHYTDSRTATYDSYSAPGAFGNLSSSKGYLLRVDAFGKTENDVNICSNCHVSKNHNVKTSKIKPSVQCNDCHSGHVEYDINDLSGAKNVNLVRRYLQYTTAGRVSKRVLYRSVTAKEFWNTTKTGVCQVCHTPPKNHYADTTQYPNGTYYPAGAYGTCIGCHNHAEGTGAFSYGTGGSCSNSCHGLPPTTSAAPGPTGPNEGYTSFNEANTPHAAHAKGGGPNVNNFDCEECHNGFLTNHQKGNDPNIVKAVFLTPRALPGYSASYSGSNCLNVYCHSTGRGTWKGPMNPISWASTKGSIIGKTTECESCHDDPNSSVSHLKHVSVGSGMGFGCVTCHASTVSNNTTLLESAKEINGTHTNAVKDVSFSTAGGALAAVGSSCATIKCHSNGKGAVPNILPTWGTASSGACGACHDTSESTRVLATGSHTVHFNFMGGTDAVICVQCHIAYTAEINVKHADGTINTGSVGCGLCHSSPYGTTITTPVWGSQSAGCGKCHSNAGAFTGTGLSPNTGSHNKHAVPVAMCGQCHAGAIAGTSGGTSHALGNVDVTGVGYPPVVAKHSIGSGYSSCSSAGATGCHVSPYNTSAVVTPTWGVVAGCASCHTGGGAFTTAGVPATGGHAKHIAASPLCVNCHAGATAGTSGGSFHIDGNIDTAAVGYTANVTKHTADSGYKTCSTAGAAGCHANPYNTLPVPTPTWGFAAGCVSCHTTGSSPATGSHTKHLAVSPLCANCHAGATADLNGGSFHNDGNIDATVVGYAVNVTKHTAGSGYKTCSSAGAAGCHVNPYNASSVSTPTWGITAGCNACHSGSGAFTGTGSAPATGSHDTHLAVSPLCANCHLGASAGSNGGSFHIDGDIDATVVGYAANVTKHTAGSGYKTCSSAGTAGCHVNPYNTSSVPTPTWGFSAGCGACHNGTGSFSGSGSSPLTGSHTKHMAASPLCTNCHVGAIAGTSGGNAHIDNNVDVTNVGYTANVTKHTAGNGYKSCSSASSTGCHLNPYNASALPTPTWGVAAGCASCHNGAGAFTGGGIAPATGSHTKHIAVSPLCANCHAGAVSGSNGGSFHIDGNVDATVVGYAANVTKHTAGSGYKTCSSAGVTGCHVNPYNTSAVPTPTWGVMAGCASCHTGSGAFTGAGLAPGTGSHTKHIAASIACASCHTGTVAGTDGGDFHIDGNIDVIGNYTVNVTKHTAGNYAGTCNTTCHATSSPSPSAVWGVDSGKDYCARCHGTTLTTAINATNRQLAAPSLPAGSGNGNVSANAKTGAHQTHLLYLNGFSNYSTIDYRCEACHGTLPSANTYTHADGASSPQTKFQKLATNRGAMTPTYSGTTCTNTYCHNPSAVVGGTLTTGLGTIVAPTWTNTAYIADGTKKTSANCNKCHRVPGDGSYVGFAHDAGLTIANDCYGCHGHDGDTQGVLGQRHMDGILMGGGDGCNGCHGYPPLTAAQVAVKGVGNYENGSAEKYPEGPGHHTSHLLPTVVITDGWAPCLPCHPSSSHHNINPSVVQRQNVDVNVAADMTYRFDGSRSKRYNSTSRICSNVSCHFQPTPVW